MKYQMDHRSAPFFRYDRFGGNKSTRWLETGDQYGLAMCTRKQLVSIFFCKKNRGNDIFANVCEQDVIDSGL